MRLFIYKSNTCNVTKKRIVSQTKGKKAEKRNKKAILENQRRKKERQKLKRQKELEKRRRILAVQQSCLGSKLLRSISEVIAQHLPDLQESLSNLPDTRKGFTYRIEELVFSAILLYVLKNETRHGLNQKRKTASFKKSYERCFKMRLPHMDTVTDVLEVLSPELLEQISLKLVKGLLKKQIFHKFRLFNRYFLVAVDATGYASYTKAPNWPCPHKCSQNGKKWWSQPILCAKLVFPNGLCLPLLTEWITNDEEYDKQDCELKAFKRLAAQLKKEFPRLPICILADGLYANGPFFDICKEHDWAYIVVFKDTKLKTIWRKIQQEQAEQQELSPKIISPSITISQSFNWVNNLSYQQHYLNWVEGNVHTHKTQQAGAQVTKNRFVSLTNLPLTKDNVAEVVEAGRCRWKIENEGFNIQKNGGYRLQHKMSRTNFFAIQNFLTCLQIGHLINQLISYSEYFKQHIQQKFTLKHCWEVLNAFLLYGQIELFHLAPSSFRYT